ncbi:MAG: D-alanyl-D-alanine carboxypeptidase family protein [Solirubrobacterales bacterium]
MIRRIAAIVGLLVALAATGIVAVAIWPEQAGEGATTTSTGGLLAGARSTSGDSARLNAGAGIGGGIAPPDIGTAPLPADTRFALRPIDQPLPVRYRFKHPPIAGVLFDVKSGRILWERHPSLERPIASLTKMMTALMVARRNRPSEHVMVSKKAAHTPGSATGLLPRGERVSLEPLLQALIMISANDAAVALAEHDGGTVTSFVKQMNLQARSMGLRCTHFSTPNGLRDRNNYSCPLDLAELARADLSNPRIAEIAKTRNAKPRFPIKGKHLYLYNNHYFLQQGLPGLPQARVTGLKTGFTDAAGRCYVTTARLAGHQLGVVLLHSPNPLLQVPALLRAGFEAMGVAAHRPPPAKPKSPAD